MTRFTRLKPYIQASTIDGITLIELIIGAAVSLVVLSITLGLVVEQRRLFLGDQTRINFNQNLRTASEFIGTDIKQVGERVEGSSPIPVIQLISGASDTDPDALILQRKLLEDRLSICSDIETGNSEIIIADEANNCNFDDGNNDSLTDSLNQFKDYRCKLETNASCGRGDTDTTNAAISDIANCDSECVYAYIYDPVQNAGEFFLYTDETTENSVGDRLNKLQVIPLDNGQFSRAYPSGNGSVIYIMEEKKYGLCDGVLQMTVNRQPDYGDDCPFPNSNPQPVRLVDGVADFQVRVRANGGWETSFNTDLSNITAFNEVESVEIDLRTEDSELLNNDSNNLSLVTQFFPRNSTSDF